MRAFHSIGHGGLGDVSRHFKEKGESRPGTGKGFTLVELLVVIGIISVLIAMLLPALNKARQQAKVVACGSQERQIAMALLMYAQDNKGWFPRVYWGGPQTLPDESAGGTWNKPASIRPYIVSATLIRCPAAGDSVREGYGGRYGNPNYYFGSYWILGGHGDRMLGSSLRSWFGWNMYHNSTASGTWRSPIPREGWAGRTVIDTNTPDNAQRTQYIDTADKQPMVVDCFDPVTKLWGGYGTGGNIMPNNHFGMLGENIAFTDGHVEWRHAKVTADGTLDPTSQVQKRFQYYSGYIYW
jgi:prepilin-type N-terminal cleavage/methylation domain-containing protein